MKKDVEHNDKITFTINPILGCLTHLEPFDFTMEIEDLDYGSLDMALIDAGHWEYFTHPCYHYEVLKRVLTTPLNNV